MVKDTLYDGVCLNSAPVGEILLDPKHDVLRRHVQSVHSKWPLSQRRAVSYCGMLHSSLRSEQ